jgi:hypothetical protein
MARPFFRDVEGLPLVDAEMVRGAADVLNADRP